MENRAALIHKRSIRWKLLIYNLEVEYQSSDNENSVPILSLEDYAAVNKETISNNIQNKSKQNKHNEGFPVLDLSDTFAVDIQRTKYDSKAKRNQQYRKCKSYNLNHIDLFMPKNNSVSKTHTLKKNSITKTGQNIDDINISNKKLKKDKSTLTQKVKVDNICKMLMERKGMRRNIDDKLSAALSSSNNNNLKITDSDDFSTSGYQSGYTSRRSSLMSDVLTDTNRELIQRMIKGISKKKLKKSHKNILTLNKLSDLNLEMSVPPMDKKCIRFYLKQMNCAVKKSVLFNLVQLMRQKEYENIQKCILGMEIFQSLNNKDNEKFRSLCSKLKEEMWKFLEFNEIKILEIFVDYILSTFDCRKRKDMF